MPQFEVIVVLPNPSDRTSEDHEHMIGQFWCLTWETAEWAGLSRVTTRVGYLGWFSRCRRW
jgi:hypothetical protein